MGDQALDCARRLREFAADPSYGARSGEMKLLADAVEGTDDDHGWIGVDLVAAFPPEATESAHGGVRLERWLGALAGVSVFLPVAWTWWSFHNAASAYEKLIAREAEDGRTFLALWTVGFDGELLGVHRLVPVALISVMLILVAILLIVAHRWEAQRNADREDSQSAECRAELVSTLTSAQRHLNMRRADDPTRIEAMVKRSVKRLLEAHDATRAGTLELKEAAQELRVALTPVIAGAAAAGTEVAQAAQAANASTEALVRAVGAAQDATRRSSAAAQQTVTNAGDEIRRALDSTLNGFSAGVTAEVAGLRTAIADSVSAAGAQAQVASDAVATEVAALHRSHAQLAAEVSKLGTVNAATGENVSAMNAGLQEALAGVEAALARHDSALQGQVSELTAARDAAERMLESLERLGDAALSRVSTP